MQLNSNADGQDLISDITFLLGGVDVNRYALKDRVRNINSRQSMVWSSIFESYGGWLFMDDNVAGTSGNVTSGSNDGPFADQALVSGTGLYGLPTGALTVMGVEIKYANGTTWIPISMLTHEEFLRMGGDSAFPTAASPWAAIVYGDVVRLLPAPNYSQSASLRVFFDQEMGYFASTDTTKVPGFAAPFHRMLSVGSALDFAIAKGLTAKIVTLTNLWNDYDARMKAYYAKRYKARFPGRIDPGEDLVDEFS